MSFVMFLALFICFGAPGFLIGAKKGRPLAGLLWGMVLGPIGWLVVWLGPTVEVKAPPRRPTALR